MKLRKATIEDLKNKCPNIVELLKNSLSEINPNDEYLEHFLGKYINRNVNRIKSNYSEDMSEEEQIKIFKKVKEIEDETLNEVMDLLSSFNRDTVLKKLKEYDYINE